MATIVHDLRYAVRLLRTRPGFAAAAILTLALGIGATTAIFSVVHAVLLSPLPFRDADRLVHVRITARDGALFPLPDTDFQAWRTQNRTADAVAVAGVTGLIVAAWGTRTLLALAPEGIPRLAEVRTNVSVFGFTFGVAALSGLLFGVAPALRASRTPLVETLKNGGRGGSGVSHRRTQRLLVVSEIALALMLSVGAGLMIRSLAALQRVGPGFEPSHLLTFRLSLPGAQYDTRDKVRDFYLALIQRLDALPGVRAAGLTISLPPHLLSMTDNFTPEGMTLPPNQSAPLGPLLFVSERYSGLDAAPEPTVYCPFRQAVNTEQYVVVRTAGEPAAIAAAARDIVGALDRELPIASMSTMDDVMTASVASPRFRTTLVSIFAALGLLLAAIGIYGVMSYAVTERTHEIGVRAALGADRGDVLRLVLGEALALAAVGVAAGLAGAFATTRLIRALLFHVEPTDPVTFIAISAVLVTAALAASYLPARRALRVDPLVALRYE